MGPVPLPWLDAKVAHCVLIDASCGRRTLGTSHNKQNHDKELEMARNVCARMQTSIEWTAFMLDAN